MAASLAEQGVARAAGNNVDRVQRMRNKLVQLAQDGDDDDRAFATAELKKLTDTYGGLSRPGENPGRTTLSDDDAPRAEMNQPDEDPSPPLTGTTTGPKANPTFMEGLDTAVAGVITNPKKLASAPWRRQMIAQVDKGGSGGLFRKMSQPFGDDMSDEALARYAEERPLSSGEKAVGQIGGMLLPGSLSRTAGGAIERGVMNLPGMGRAAGLMPKVVGAGVGAASAAGSNAVQAGTEAATGTPGNLAERLGAGARAAKAAATDPVAAGMGAAGGAIFGAGAGVRAGSKNVQTIEGRGGRVSTFDPGSGGALDDPLIQRGIDSKGRVTEFGKGQVARSAADTAADTIEGRAAAAGGRLRAGTEQARQAGQLDKAVDPMELYQQAQDIVNNPLRYSRGTRARVQKEVIDDIFAPRMPKTPTGTPLEQAAAREQQVPMMITADEMNTIKQKLSDLADYVPEGKAGLADPTFSRLAHTARQNVGDDLTRLNREAATEYSGIEDARSALGIPGGANQPVSMAQREGLAGRLGRRGADTRTAGQIETPELQAALERYPELRRLIEAPELLQARANLQFVGPSENSVGGLGTWLKGMIGRNVEPAVVRLVAPLLMGAGNTVRTAAPATGSFIENLGEGARRKMDQR